MEIDVWVPIKPVAKQRPRLARRRKGRGNVAYTPIPTRNFEAAVADHVRREIGCHPLFGEQPVCVRIEIHTDGFHLHVSHAEASVRPNGIRGDIDNIVKSIFDGLNDVTWKDDKQVEAMEVVFVGVPRKGTTYVGD